MQYSEEVFQPLILMDFLTMVLAQRYTPGGGLVGWLITYLPVNAPSALTWPLSGEVLQPTELYLQVCLHVLLSMLFFYQSIPILIFKAMQFAFLACCILFVNSEMPDII